MTIYLPSDLEITNNAENRLIAFAREEYAYYDGIEDSTPGGITPVDVLATFSVNSFIGSASRIRRIHRGLANACDELLAEIGPTSRLQADDWPEQQVSGLFHNACKLPYVLMAVATKVLHRKRPALIPMLDSVIIKHYAEDTDLPRSQDKRYAAEVGMSALGKFRTDLISAHDELDHLVKKVGDAGYAYTHVRALEILIWIQIEPNGVYR